MMHSGNKKEWKKRIRGLPMGAPAGDLIRSQQPQLQLQPQLFSQPQLHPQLQP